MLPTAALRRLMLVALYDKVMGGGRELPHFEFLWQSGASDRRLKRLVERRNHAQSKLRKRNVGEFQRQTFREQTHFEP